MKVVPIEKGKKVRNKNLVKILKKTVREAKNGEVSGLVLLVERHDGDWCHRGAGGNDIDARIGRLEIMKQDIVLGRIYDED